MSDSKHLVERRVFMGIGDAVLRLIHVERMVADGAHPPPPLLAERDLIVEALNQQYQLDLGMDCDADGIPDAIDDDVSILTHAAKTSCCRISPSPQGGRSEEFPSPRKTRGSSRKTDTKPIEAPPVIQPDKTPIIQPDKTKGGFFSTLFGSSSNKED